MSVLLIVSLRDAAGDKTSIKAGVVIMIVATIIWTVFWFL